MNPNSLSALILSKTLDIDPTLFDAEIRRLSNKGSLGGVIGKHALGKITPDAVKKLNETIKRFKGRRVRMGREILEKREQLLSKKRGYSRSSLNFILKQLSKDKSYAAGERNLLQALEANTDPKLLNRFWNIKEQSPQEKIVSSPAGKEFLRSLQKDKGFVRAYNQTMSGDEMDLPKPGGSTGTNSFFSGSESFSGSTRSRRGSGVLGSSDRSSDLQEATYSLMKMSFKETNDLLKKILTAIGNIEPGSGGGLVPDILNPRKNPKVAKALAAVVPFAKKAIKIAPLAVAGFEAFGDVSQIDKAEQAGIYTKERASALRKRAMLRRTSAAVGGIATGALGTLTTGGLGTVAGGVVGYNLGDAIGRSLGDSVFGTGEDRDSGYYAAVASIESSLGDKKKPPRGNALGLYQFMPTTWNKINQEYHKGYGNVAGSSDPNDPRLDNAKSLDMMKLLTTSNKASLERKLGRPVSESELYMAHFMGDSGAAKLIQADANMIAAQMFPKSAAMNPNDFLNKDGSARTVGDLRSIINKKYASAAASVGAVPDMALPMIPELATAQMISSASSTQQPITDSDMKTFTQQKVVQQNAQANSTALMTAAITKLSKDSAVAKNSKLNSDGSLRFSSSGGGGGGGPNQSAFNDINSIHMMDGLLLNILTD